MKQFVTIALLALCSAFTALAQSPITTTQLFGTGACVGSTCALTDSVTGGTWSCSSVTIATVDASGLVTGITPGSTTITYTVAGGGYVTTPFYVTAVPAGITGAATLCIGGTLTLADATVGGSWSGGSVAGVNSMTGLVTAFTGGSQDIYYIVGEGCYASTTVTVNPTVFPIDSLILGPSTVCIGSTITLSNATSGGSWSSSNLAIGSVNPSSGVVTGIAAGTTLISYTVPSGSCGPESITTTITVTGATSAGSVSGPSVSYIGSPAITLADVSGDPGGTWSSSNIAVATIGTSTGVVTAVAPGTATLTYSVSGCGGTATATQTNTVSTINGISGYVLFSSAPASSTIKVWLITYNPSTLMLEAIDSTMASGSGTSYFYQFLSEPTDSFRIKAALPDSTGVTFIPTYHDTSFYWNAASVVAHTTSTADINENINMLAGIATTGPGFIGGSVTTGANRTTSGGSGIPVSGLNIVAVYNTTNTIAGITTTDATGSYSFSNLPYGTYTIFPDSVNYYTTPYSGITISSATPTITGAGFIQHTISHSITPNPTAVSNVAAAANTVNVFPNPSSGKLNLLWSVKATEKAAIAVTDITGREVYTTSLNLAQGSGTSSFNLSELINGIYIISVKSASLDYTNKIQVMH